MKTLPGISKITAHKNFPILVLIGINIIVGLIIVTDYGESWDEIYRYEYAQASLDAYLGNVGRVIDDKGTFFIMLATIGGSLLHPLRGDWLMLDARHFVYFLSFLMGLFFFYRLCLRFATKWAAFGATLIFNTQPLLWGHAFMNPKDIPFMAFFIAGMDLGLEMADSFLGGPENKDGEAAQNQVSDTFLKRVWLGLTNKKVVTAGVFLGLVSAIRTLGPAVGLLIGAYLLISVKRRALPVSIAYFTIGALVTHLAWPGLWSAPVISYLTYLFASSNFPWIGTVLFGGAEIPPSQLPRTYLPVLLSIQFTPPTVVLILAGFAAAIIQGFRSKHHWKKLAVIGLWFFAPILMAILARPNMYDNFRHFLFTIPPLFVRS